MDVGPGDGPNGSDQAGRGRALSAATPGADARGEPAAQGGSGRSRLVRRLLNLAVFLVSAGGLAWLVATKGGELGRAVAGVGHAKLGLAGAAVFCERVSMFSFARVQQRLLRAGGQRLTLASAIGIAFAGNALSVSVPIAGPGLGVAFTFREFARHKVDRPAAAFALVVSGVLSTVSLMLIVAAGLLASGNAVAAILGLVPAVLILAGIAAGLFGLRVTAWRRLLQRSAVGCVRTTQRLRRKPGDPPETLVARAREQLAGLHLSRGDWAAVVALVFLNWLGDAACLALSIRAAKLAIPLRHLLLVWSAGQVAGAIGLTPGGVGVVEVALVAALVGTGTPATGAAVAVMIYRLISLWLVLLVGWILYLVIRSRRARRASE